MRAEIQIPVSDGFRRSKSDIGREKEIVYDPFVYISCGVCSLFYHEI